MRNVAKLSSRLNWRRAARGAPPQLYLFTDQRRLADPAELLVRLPRGAVVVLRHPDSAALEALARKTVPAAHRLRLKVLLAGPVRTALKCRADGVHLSERAARRGPLRIRAALPPGFFVSAAAHGGPALMRAARAGADVAVLSPVFPTESHPRAPVLGPLRFARLAAGSAVPVVALGGMTWRRARRLRLGPAHGVAAIGGWRD